MDKADKVFSVKDAKGRIFNSLRQGTCLGTFLVNLSVLAAIPTEGQKGVVLIFKYLQMARIVLSSSADEVARNGAHLRITSARGFLGRPLQFLESISIAKSVILPWPKSALPRSGQE